MSLKNEKRKKKKQEKNDPENSHLVNLSDILRNTRKPI
jgi:hypothetical protein